MKGVNEYYTVVVNEVIETETQSGKLKYKNKKHKYLVYSKDIPTVYKIVNIECKAIFDDYEIIDVKASNYIGFINGNSSKFKETEETDEH